MSTFTLAISCFDHFQFALIHEPDIPGSYLILLFTASDLASMTSHIHNWVMFLLWLISSFFLELFLHWSPGAYWALPTWGVHLSVSYHFAFSHCSWGSKSKNTEVVCHSLLQWTTFCQTSPPWPSRLGWPHTAWLSFIELDKAVVHVIRLASFLWLWFQCVCPLMPSCNTYHLTWVIGDWNAKVRNQETPGVTGKFGLGVRNEAGQRLIEFFQENALVIANTLFQ